MENIPPSPALAPPEQPGEIRKRISWKLVLAIVLPAAAVAAVIVFKPSLIPFLGTEPKQEDLLLVREPPAEETIVTDGDLALQKVEIADADNGYFKLAQAGEAVNGIYEASRGTGYDDVTLGLTNYKSPIAWNQALVDDLLKKNEPALRYFDEAVEKSSFQSPKNVDPSSPGFGSPELPANGIRDVSRLKAIQALNYAYTGDFGKGVSEAAKIIVLGNRIKNSQGPLFLSSFGITLEKLGSETILDILPYGTYDPAILTSLVRNIESLDFSGTGLKNHFRVEYYFAKKSINDFIPGKTTSIGGLSGMNFAEDAEEMELFKQPSYFNKQQTLSLVADFYREMIDAAGVACGADREKYNTRYLEAEEQGRENVFGYHLVNWLATKGVVLSLDCESRLIVSVAKTQLALRGYVQSTGKVPASLDDLVPAYLKAVPEDPYDHKPLRYIPGKALYSVGGDKEDGGGSEGFDWATMDDPTFRIKFGQQ